MIGPVLQFADLQEICRPGANPRRATVEDWLDQRGIRYMPDGAGGIITTVEAFNAALGIGKAANDGKYDNLTF